jgi:hypothetical protein
MWKLGNVEMWKLSKATFMTTSTIIMNKLGTNHNKTILPQSHCPFSHLHIFTFSH